MIAAIDPGTEQSALVEWRPDPPLIGRAEILPNEEILAKLEPHAGLDVLVIEWIVSYGMPVGQETFDTCRWIGRFQERWEVAGGEVFLIPRLDVKLAICKSPKANDATIRRALMDRFGGDRSVGTKKAPGPLYGIKSHLWSALAVAVAWGERENGA